MLWKQKVTIAQEIKGHSLVMQQRGLSDKKMPHVSAAVANNASLIKGMNGLHFYAVDNIG